MGRPIAAIGHGWYSLTVKLLGLYPDRLGGGEFGDAARSAINDALEETRELPNGEDRLRMVRMFYFDKTHNLAGVSMRIHWSQRTVQRWNESFIRCVVKHLRE